jgi:eukaryotic-like serine/threonine-protein kinase
MSDDLTQAPTPSPSDAPATQSPAPADTGYEIGIEIARGGMGTIHRGRDRALDREVAIKILQDRYPSGSLTARRFVDEARITGQLQHPGIPPIHHVGTLPDGRPFLAMKLVKGRTLDEILKERDGTNRLAVFEAVCQAVGYAHAHRVIHRDLKPANVMVGSFSEVQVMDWGLAKVLDRPEARIVAEDPNATTALGTAIRRSADSTDDVTQDGDVLGTPAYMPPEQAIGAIDDVDARSDVFGLGAILCAILTGQPPFVGGDAKSTRQMAAKGKLDDAFARLDRSGADPEWIALAKRCLSSEKADRPADANVVAAEAARLRADAEERAKRAELERERARVQAEELRKRRRVQAALAGAVALLLFAGGAFAWWLDHQAEQRKAEALRKELEDQQRKSANAAAVAALLERGEGALRRDDLETAALAIDQAKRLMAEGGAEEHERRLGRLGADVMFLRDLIAIDEFRWTPDRDTGFMPSKELVIERFVVALSKLGLLPMPDRGEAISARLADSPLRDRVVDIYERMLWVYREADVATVLAKVDPDPYRDRFRAAIVANDSKAIAAMIERPEFLEQPAGFVGLAAWASPVPDTIRRDIVNRVVLRWPNNPGVLVNAGYLFPTNRRTGSDERLRWFQAALAAHPNNIYPLNGIGLALHHRGDYDDAILYFREAIRQAPKNAISWNNLGISQRDLGRYDEARKSFEESIRLDPAYANAHRNLGTIANKTGDLVRARIHFEDSLRINPKYAIAHVDLALLDRAEGHIERARERIVKALEIEPELALAHMNLGHTCVDMCDYDGALAAFRKAADLDPVSYSFIAFRGYVLLRRDGPAAAIDSFKEAVRVGPNIDQNWISLANAQRDSGRLPDAIATYREAIERHPNNVHFHNNLGAMLRDAGQLDEAMRCFERAHQINPRAGIPIRNIGTIHQRRNERDKAIAKFREAMAVEPGYTQARMDLAYQLRLQGKLDEATAETEAAIQSDPRNVTAWIDLGFCWKHQQFPEKAIACFQEAIRLNPKYAPPWYNMGDLRQAQGDLLGAMRCFEQAIERDPRHAAALNSLAWILAAGPIEFRDGKRAIELATRACEASRWNDPNHVDTLAVAHAATGDFAKAIEVQDRALNFPNIEMRGGPQMRKQRELFRQGQPYTDPGLAHRAREVAPVPRAR